MEEGNDGSDADMDMVERNGDIGDVDNDTNYDSEWEYEEENIPNNVHVSIDGELILDNSVFTPVIGENSVDNMAKNNTQNKEKEEQPHLAFVDDIAVPQFVLQAGQEMEVSSNEFVDDIDMSQLVMLAGVATDSINSENESVDDDQDDSDDDSEAEQIMGIGPPSKRARNVGGRRRGGGVRTRGGGRARRRGVRVRGGTRGVVVRGGHGGGSARGGGGNIQCGGAQWTWEEVIQDTDTEMRDFPFVEQEGLRQRMKNNVSVLDYLELYMTDHIIEHLVNETNRYADQFIANNLEQAQNSYIKHWTQVTVTEIKKFIGVLLLMGIIYKPTTHMYWSTDELYSTPIFSEVMNRDHFHLLSKFLHFNDNKDPGYDPKDDNRDRLHKVRPFLDLMRMQMRTVYSPGRELSVDESLVLFKGRLHFKQFIRTKRARFGIKLYELTTSQGITFDMLVYCGKGMFHDDDPHSDSPTTERIPQILM